MADAVLALESVVKDYGDRVVTRVLHGIDAHLDQGELTALTGPSGSGKSTLLNLIGLLDRPTSGRVRIQGKDTGILDDDTLTAFRGSVLGFIFQFHHLLPELTAAENVILPRMAVSGRFREEMLDAARALLRDVGLEKEVDRRATDLSGGQQQRVAVARALSNDPKLVLADEPTGNLDTKTADQIFALLRRFNTDRGTTFLVVTHDPRIAARCDRVIDLVDGRVRSDTRR